jgi:hypothetical protein
MKTQIALVVIPEEAEKLIPILRAITTPLVHLILYAAPVTKRMLHFNRLDYYALPSLPAEWKPPSWLPFELGILAGRLYFGYSEYSLLLDRLHVKLEENEPGDEIAEYDGNNGKKQLTTAQTPQSKNNLMFLQEWLSLRRQGQDISHTPMGYVCQSWKLRSDHPFFSTEEPAVEEASGAVTNGHLFHPEYDSASHSDHEEYYDYIDEGEDDVGLLDVDGDEEAEEYRDGGISLTS